VDIRNAAKGGAEVDIRLPFRVVARPIAIHGVSS
jgi:hypothetical protein